MRPTQSATIRARSARGGDGFRQRPLATLPKAHLHLHFTGSMRHHTLLELAERDGIHLPDSLVERVAAAAVGGRREGLVPVPAALRRRAVGAAHRGRRTPAGARGGRGRRPRRRPVAGDPGRPVGLRRPLRRDHRLHRPGARRRGEAVARHRPRHRRGRSPPTAPGTRSTPGPWPGWPPSTPAAASSGSGCPTTSGAGARRTSRPAFAIAERAGLLLVPHGGELRGPDHVRTCLDTLHAEPARPRRPRRPRTPACSTEVVEAGIALEVCPVSNVALGVYSDLTSVPLPQLLAAGATVALGADDPLLFGSRLAGQYATMRAAHELTDAQLAELARMSFRASRAPSDLVAAALADDRRLAGRRPPEGLAGTATGVAAAPARPAGWRHDRAPARHPQPGPRPRAVPDDAVAFWEEKYAGSTGIWSGEPNRALVDEAPDLAPGHALDLGCGEGGDAPLARRAGLDRHRARPVPDGPGPGRGRRPGGRPRRPAPARGRRPRRPGDLARRRPVRPGDRVLPADPAGVPAHRRAAPRRRAGHAGRPPAGGRARRTAAMGGPSARAGRRVPPCRARARRPRARRHWEVLVAEDRARRPPARTGSRDRCSTASSEPDAADPAQSSQPTSTGSLTSRMPNAASTPSRTSRASASRSAVVAPPRLVSASVCLDGRAAPRPAP